MGNIFKNIVWAGWNQVAKLAGRSYVAGSELSEALEACRKFANNGYTGTICYWNADADEPRFVADQYLAALDDLTQTELDCYLSIKTPALGFSHPLMAEIIEKAKATRVRLHFDSHAPEQADQTLDLLAASLPRFSRLSLTLPGRWRRSLRDADWACKLGLTVRVVKGQWADPDDPEIDMREGFLNVIDRLAGRASHVAVASHDAPLASEALHRLRAAGTSCELELLFGLPLYESVRAALEAEVPVRIYIPYGDAWVPYCLSQIKKNPRMLKWVVQSALFGRQLVLLDANRLSVK